MKIYNKIKLNSLDSRQLGAAALELGFVAAGRTECIVIPGANCWDVGAGTLLVREAGGKVTDIQGKDIRFDLSARKFGKNYTILASGTKLHRKLMLTIELK